MPLNKMIGFIICLVLLFLAAGSAGAASRPARVADIALYRGPDREQVLIEGAKKEGQILFYNSNTWMSMVAQAFEKKYPIKITIWRSEAPNIVKRLVEEYQSGKFLADVVETSDPGMGIIYRQGIYQEYYSPHGVQYSDEVKEKGKIGVFYMADREYYTGLGFNTKLVSPAEAPKTYQDLLDPKWKGRMSMSGGGIGPKWVGHILEAMGRDYLEKLSRQEIKLQNISPVALLDYVVNGEVPLSPTIGDPNVFTAKRDGAPVEWRALEPAMVNVGFGGMTIKAPHPFASVLFLDFLHSKEGQQIVMKGGLSTPRSDMGSTEKKFKKSYFGLKYSLEEYEKKYTEWEDLMTRLFLRKK